jgi:hemoglobin
MKTTLFERLGGTSGISKLVDDAVEAHMNNPEVQKRFLPLREQPEKLAVIKQHSIDFFSAGSGGNVNYTGRDMVTAHKGMNISPAEYVHVIDDILMAMDKHALDQDTKNEVLGILWSLKGMIIAQ